MSNSSIEKELTEAVKSLDNIAEDEVNRLRRKDDSARLRSAADYIEKHAKWISEYK